MEKIVLILDLAITFLLAYLLSAGMIWVALPFAGSLALAVPNARSSHAKPTPQSGGLFLAATIIFIAIALCAWHENFKPEILKTLVPIICLAFIGWLDDRRGLPIFQRLVAFSVISVAYAAMSVPTFNGFVAPPLGVLLGSFFLIVLINITNFMDGIDGMIVAEFVPMSIFLAILAGSGLVGQFYGFLAVILSGALLGFFVFNRPKAKIFLGDSGSLVVGFIGGIFLLEVSEKLGPQAIVLLPLYFLCDAGFTLARRLLRREHFWKAHRQHFYQKAFDNKQSNWSIIIRVALCNFLLCLMFYCTTILPVWGGIIAALTAFGSVGLLLVSLLRIPRFSATKSRGTN